MYMVLNEIAEKYDPTSPEKDFDYWLLTFDFEILANISERKEGYRTGLW